MQTNAHITTIKYISRDQPQHALSAPVEACGGHSWHSVSVAVPKQASATHFTTEDTRATATISLMATGLYERRSLLTQCVSCSFRRENYSPHARPPHQFHHCRTSSSATSCNEARGEREYRNHSPLEHQRMIASVAGVWHECQYTRSCQASCKRCKEWLFISRTLMFVSSVVLCHSGFNYHDDLRIVLVV
jgi:hypothetical protein